MLGEDKPVDEEMLAALAEAMSHLKSSERDVIVLRYYHGYKLKTIAEKMGMSYANAKLLHAKALLRLREKLQ